MDTNLPAHPAHHPGTAAAAAAAAATVAAAPAAPKAPPASTPRSHVGRLVTDAPTRMFHWLFSLSFLGAYLSAEGEQWRLVHVTLGYTMAGLLAWRVLYGLFGPRQARLGPMWRKLRSAPAWLRSVLQSRSISAVNVRQGQNLLMALAVVALLALALPLTLSGYASEHDWADALGGALGGEAVEDLQGSSATHFSRWCWAIWH